VSKGNEQETEKLSREERTDLETRQERLTSFLLDLLREVQEQETVQQ